MIASYDGLADGAIWFPLEEGFWFFGALAKERQVQATTGAVFSRPQVSAQQLTPTIAHSRSAGVVSSL